MVLDWSMFSFSDEEKASFLVIYSSHYPFLVIDIIGNLVYLISLATYNQKNILKVLCIDGLVLVSFHHGIKII